MEIGTVIRGREIARKPGNLYAWAACADCGAERWVEKNNGAVRSVRCHPCGVAEYQGRHTGPKSATWKGGRYVTTQGYIQRVILGEYPFPDSLRRTRSGLPTILEHRMVWEQGHNKPLPKGCHVHHINGVRDDNRLENLMALSVGEHGAKRYEAQQILQKRIRQLEVQVKLLRENR